MLALAMMVSMNIGYCRWSYRVLPRSGYLGPEVRHQSQDGRGAGARLPGHILGGREPHLGHLEHLENLVQVRGQLMFLLTSHSRAKVLHLRELLADRDPLWSRSWSFFLVLVLALILVLVTDFAGDGVLVLGYRYFHRVGRWSGLSAGLSLDPSLKSRCT